MGNFVATFNGGPWDGSTVSLATTRAWLWLSGPDVMDEVAVPGSVPYVLEDLEGARAAYYFAGHRYIACDCGCVHARYNADGIRVVACSLCGQEIPTP